MDEDTRNFLQHIYESLDRRMGEIAATMATHEDIEQLSATFDEKLAVLRDELRTPIFELRHVVVTYSQNMSTMLKNITGGQLEVSIEIDEIKRRFAEMDRRVSALEQRLTPPPEAAA